MTTNPNLESIGVSLIDEQLAPTQSKHELNLKRDEARLHRIEAKELRLFNNEMVPYNKNRELTDVLGNPRDKIMQQLNQGNYKIINNEREAIKTPYRRVA